MIVSTRVVRIATPALVLACIIALLGVAGCDSTPKLMPTPNLYARGEVDPFDNVPPHFQNNAVDVLYLTDRARGEDEKGQPTYGYKRSRSVAFGVSHVEIGKDVSWEQLVEASRSAKRGRRLDLNITRTEEMGRFPATPRTLVEVPETVFATTRPDSATQTVAQPTTSFSTLRMEVSEAMTRAQQLLSARLAETDVKDVYVFVHGYNNNFRDSVTTIAQLWHFLGRQGVPVAYSWPAGRGGLLKGYTYDRESSEFTVYHLKQMIAHIAENPDVAKIHIIAHSRGTDVAVSALRELHLEIGGSGRSTRQVLKLGVFVLAAPDIDFDVLIQRAVTARLGRVPESTIVYVCASDEALGISNWLFGGLTRLGKIRSDVFSKEELEGLRANKSVQVIDARISEAGAFGHDYFHSSPAVSSDLILAIRYGLQAGAESGRPLKHQEHGFWEIDDKYPEGPTIGTTRPAAPPAVAEQQSP